MRQALIHRKRYTLALFMCIILAANLVASPSVTLQEERRFLYTEITSPLNDVQLPLEHKDRTYSITVFSENEMRSEATVHFIVNRNIQNISNIIIKINQILSPSIGFCVMIYCFGYVIRKKQRHKSILSRFLGGHAPPKTVFVV